MRAVSGLGRGNGAVPGPDSGAYDAIRGKNSPDGPSEAEVANPSANCGSTGRDYPLQVYLPAGKLNGESNGENGHGVHAQTLKRADLRLPEKEPDEDKTPVEAD